MKVLLIGGMGSIGRRYQAVLNYLKVPFEILDIEFGLFVQYVGLPDGLMKDITHILIASPTDTHLPYLKLASKRDLPILCEKPLTKDLKEAEEIAELYKGKPAFVVNNYAFLSSNLEFKKKPEFIYWDFYNSGKDGLIWDVCQLVYLASITGATLEVHQESYFWDCKIDEWDVPYRAIEESYLQMIRAFLMGNYHQLWTLQQGVEMTKVCLQLEQKLQQGEKKNEGIMWYPSENKLISASS